mgnify:CR=1 FL=1
MNYWLMKTEPDTFSIEDLKNKKISDWDGVRNYQARNFMRDDMRNGDRVLIYHSSCKNVGVAGIAEVIKESHPDYTCWDESSDYYDPKSTKDDPRWFMVTVKWIETFDRIIPLTEIKTNKQLQGMLLIKKGNRLSITPVKKSEYDLILKLV